MASLRSRKTPDKKSDWQDEEPSFTEKANFKLALGRYIVKMDLVDDPPSDCMFTYKSILPFITAIDPRWEKVGPKDLNPGKYKAHKHFVDALRNTLKSDSNLAKAIEEAEAELTQLQPEEESEKLSEREDEPAQDKDTPPHKAVRFDHKTTKDKHPASAHSSAKLTSESKDNVGRKRPSQEALKDPSEPSSSLKRMRVEDLDLAHSKVRERYDQYLEARKAWEELISSLKFLEDPVPEDSGKGGY